MVHSASLNLQDDTWLMPSQPGPSPCLASCASNRGTRCYNNLILVVAPHHKRILGAGPSATSLTALDVSMYGQHMATGNDAGTIFVWHLSQLDEACAGAHALSGLCVPLIASWQAHDGPVSSLSIVAERLVVTCSRNVITMWSTDGTSVGTFGQPVRSAGFLLCHGQYLLHSDKAKSDLLQTAWTLPNDSCLDAVKDEANKCTAHTEARMSHSTATATKPKPGMKSLLCKTSSLTEQEKTMDTEYGDMVITSDTIGSKRALLDILAKCASCFVSTACVPAHGTANIPSCRTS
jgi:WD40 repeat protein